MEIDIDKELVAFDAWRQKAQEPDTPTRMVDIWLAAKRHAAQVAEECTMLPAGLDREQKRAFIVAHAEPSGASVDSVELLALLDAYCQDGTKGYEHHYLRIVAHIDAWNASRSSVDSVARDAARWEFVEEHGVTQGGGSGFKISCWIPFDEEDMGVGVDRAIAAMSPTEAGEGR